MKLRFKLNPKQKEKMSDIFSDIALVALASIVLPALLDKFSIIESSIGLLFAIVLWIVSLFLRR